MPRETLDSLRQQLHAERQQAQANLATERERGEKIERELAVVLRQNAKLEAVLSVVRAALGQAEEDIRG